MIRRTEAAVFLLLVATRAVAQTPVEVGQWDGLARLPGQGLMRVTITLDSSAAGWTGLVLVPSARPQPFPMAAVARNQDSLIVRLPAEAQNAVLRLRISSDGKQMAGIIEAQTRGALSAARTGSPEAAALTEGLTRLERSRDAANRLAASTREAPPPSANPDSARLVTSDIPLFWKTLDRAPADSLAEYLQRDYLENASVGVRDFIPGRIMSAEDLATAVRSSRAKYDSVRAANLDVVRAEPQIRAAFRKLKELYPDAVFPDVYFVIGRFNSGGTASQRGLLIGAEMYAIPRHCRGSWRMSSSISSSTTRQRSCSSTRSWRARRTSWAT